MALAAIKRNVKLFWENNAIWSKSIYGVFSGVQNGVRNTRNGVRKLKKIA